MASLRPVRRALDGLLPYDAEAVQRWALKRVTDEVVRSASVRPRMLLVCDGHVEDIDLADAAGGDPIATFVG
ncbi:MAG: hypothetical protein ABMB14_18830, partial [Myxococcota bacterium]